MCPAAPASQTGYQLIDFGRGRRLEWCGGYWIDRPAPVVESIATSRADWPAQRLVFHRRTTQQGQWTGPDPFPEAWELTMHGIRFRLRPAASGQLGVFPEQAGNWDWLREGLRTGREETTGLRVLNLFGYTGGSTLAAAQAGADVTHVDASRPAVTWARENAQLNGLSQHPIRWIVDDAMKFVQRELRRRRTYHAIVLDPPAYGHGGKSGRWLLERDLPQLLDLCGQLLAPDARLILATCHASELTPVGLAQLVRRAAVQVPLDWSHGWMPLRDVQRRELPSGMVVRGIRHGP